MRVKIDELWPQTPVAVAFLYAILCVITRTTRKLKVVYKNVSPSERLLYYRRYLFSCVEQYVRYDRRVMDPNTDRNHFSIRHCMRTYTRNSRTICGRCIYISNNCSTIGERAGCEIRMASYASKHALQSLSEKLFLRIMCT